MQTRLRFFPITKSINKFWQLFNFSLLIYIDNIINKELILGNIFIFHNTVVPDHGNPIFLTSTRLLVIVWFKTLNFLLSIFPTYLEYLCLKLKRRLHFNIHICSNVFFFLITIIKKDHFQFMPIYNLPTYFFKIKLTFFFYFNKISSTNKLILMLSLIPILKISLSPIITNNSVTKASNRKERRHSCLVP